MATIQPYSENTDKRIVKILDDPCTSFWLKDALLAALQRDPVDALNDCNHLAEILIDRNDEITRYYKARFEIKPDKRLNSQRENF